MLFPKTFSTTDFVFLPRLVRMSFLDEILQALRIFVNVSTQKNSEFFEIFEIFSDTAQNQAACIEMVLHGLLHDAVQLLIIQVEPVFFRSNQHMRQGNACIEQILI